VGDRSKVRRGPGVPREPRCTQECVEIRWLTPRISTIAILYRAGSTKARFGGGDGSVTAQAVGRSAISGFCSPWKRWLWRAGAVMRPARRFAFWRSGTSIQDLNP